MRVTLLQTDIRWAQHEVNILEAQRLMDLAEAEAVTDGDSEAGGNSEADGNGNSRADGDSRLFVLPEMWSTGFATEPADIAAAEEANPALQWMQQAARQHRCAISGSLAVRLPDGTYRNRHYFADGISGQTSYYDKHHLFTYGHEDRYYTPGQQHTIVEWGGFRLLLLTCYDLRFPVWSRYSTEREYDAIVIVANWPSSRQAAWQLLTRSRAIENECYVIAANRVGNDLRNRYAGYSCVIDSYGKTLGQCRRDSVQWLTVDLSLSELRRRRSKFRVLDDRDENLII